MNKLIYLSALLLGACAVTSSIQNNISHIDQSQIARPAFMVERNIQIGNETTRIWERMHQRHAPARLYIGGEDDLGLILASKDKSDNVLWAPVIDEGSLDHIKRLYTLTGFDAVLVNKIGRLTHEWLSTRKDVLSLRTVAATLPAIQDIAPELANIPQVHFTGAMDETETPAHYHAFRQAMGQSECVKYALMPDADHTDGWEIIWPKLLKIKPECKTDIPAVPVRVETTPTLPIKLYKK